MHAEKGWLGEGGGAAGRTFQWYTTTLRRPSSGAVTAARARLHGPVGPNWSNTRGPACSVARSSAQRHRQLEASGALDEPGIEDGTSFNVTAGGQRIAKNGEKEAERNGESEKKEKETKAASKREIVQESERQSELE